MSAPLYTTEILRLAASLAEPAELDRIDGSAEVRSPTCGSIVRTEVSLGPDGRVEALSQHVRACAFGQASASLLGRGAVGRSRTDIDEALAAVGAWLDGSGALPEWPGLAELAPARGRTGRHAAILLPFRALLAAIEAGK